MKSKLTSDEMAKEIFKSSYGKDSEPANTILCLNISLSKIARDVSEKSKCDFCRDDVWMATSTSNSELVSKKAKKMCIICAKKKTDNGEIKVPGLMEGIVGMGFN